MALKDQGGTASGAGSDILAALAGLGVAAPIPTAPALISAARDIQNANTPSATPSVGWVTNQGYVTAKGAAAAAPVQTVAGRIGAIVLAATDVSNAANLSLGSNQFEGILIQKATSTSISVSSTYTPEMTSGAYHTLTISTVNSVVIARPVFNSVAYGDGTHSATLTIETHNSTAGSLSLSWNAIYSFGSFASTGPAAGASRLFVFQWAPILGKWYAIAVN